MLGYYLIAAFYVILNPIINIPNFDGLLDFMNSTTTSIHNTPVGIFGEGPTSQNAIIVMLGSAMTMNKYFPISEALIAIVLIGGLQIIAFTINAIKFVARMIPTVNVK
jgi:hypothetical protein